MNENLTSLDLFENVCVLHICCKSTKTRERELLLKENIVTNLII